MDPKIRLVKLLASCWRPARAALLEPFGRRAVADKRARVRHGRNPDVRLAQAAVAAEVLGGKSLRPGAGDGPRELCLWRGLGCCEQEGGVVHRCVSEVLVAYLSLQSLVAKHCVNLVSYMPLALRTALLPCVFWPHSCHHASRGSFPGRVARWPSADLQ